MSKRTIAKFLAFVILILLTSIVSPSCGYVRSNDREKPDFDLANSPFSGPRITGRIESKEIIESSGLTVSKCQAGVLWTHNDSGDGPFIFALDLAGNNLGTWKVTGADNRDWEDLASFKDAHGNCYLYIGDIGNNQGRRDRTLIYVVKEPRATPDTAQSIKKTGLQTEPAATITVDYPSGRPNAETLMVHPVTGDIYIVSKLFSGPAAVYKLSPQTAAGSPVTAQKVAGLSVPAVPNGLLTGGDISPDGARVLICDYVAGYEFTLPRGAAMFDEIWHQPPVKFDIGDRKTGEAIAYSADGNTIFSSSEGRNAPIFEMRRKENRH